MSSIVGDPTSHPTSRPFSPIRNKDGFLSFGELKAALSSSRAGLTTAEIRALFAHLETEGGARRAGGGGGDASGVTPWQPLLDAIRPRLSGERLGLVRLAFGKMDKEGKGTVSPETITNRYVSSLARGVIGWCGPFLRSCMAGERWSDFFLCAGSLLLRRISSVCRRSTPPLYSPLSNETMLPPKRQIRCFETPRGAEGARHDGGGATGIARHFFFRDRRRRRRGKKEDQPVHIRGCQSLSC